MKTVVKVKPNQRRIENEKKETNKVDISLIHQNND